MADDLAAVNQALAHLGEPSIDSLLPASLNPAARKVMPFQAQALDALLERHGWLCALEYATLHPAPSGGNFKYAYRFNLAGNFLRLWGEPSWAGAWEVGSATDGDGATVRVLRAQTPGPLNVSYVRRITVAALTPTLFDAYALDLAARSCRQITGSVEVARVLRQQADQAVMVAMGIEGMQEGGQAPAFYSPLADIRGGDDDFPFGSGYR